MRQTVPIVEMSAAVEYKPKIILPGRDVDFGDNPRFPEKLEIINPIKNSQLLTIEP